MTAAALNRVLGRWLAVLADDWLPAACVVCGSDRRGLHWAATGLCEACAGALPGAWARRCPRCGIGVGATSAAMATCAPACDYPPPDWPECDDCQADPPPFDCTIAAADYSPPLDRLLHALKFGRDAALARPLGGWLGLRLPASAAAAAGPPAGTASTPGVASTPATPIAPIIPVPLVTAVPLAPQRLAERGFNQSLEIARAMARQAGLPLAPHLLRRPHSAAPAATLDAAERRAALHDAFVAPQALTGRDVFVVDDVMTTGATLRAAASALKRAGAAHVVNCVIARTPAAHVQRRSGPP